MIYGYARLSTDVAVLKEVASGAKSDRKELARVLDAGDTLFVSYIHTLSHSTISGLRV